MWLDAFQQFGWLHSDMFLLHCWSSCYRICSMQVNTASGIDQNMKHIHCILKTLSSDAVQVLKALADDKEESVQPKKPKAEPQPRTPYVPKQPQPRGQKRQGKGNQQGPKGKKQKKDSLADNAADAHTEAPPLPPPDSPSPFDSSQTIAEAELEDDESLPAPPLPPPSPNHAALANGHSSGQLPSASGPQLHFPVPLLDNSQPRPITLSPPDASAAPHARAQVGFKLPMNKRQKLMMTAAEEPADQEMRLRLERHLAVQQQQQQQQQPQPQMVSSRHQLPNGQLTHSFICAPHHRSTPMHLRLTHSTASRLNSILDLVSSNSISHIGCKGLQGRVPLKSQPPHCQVLTYITQPSSFQCSCSSSRLSLLCRQA